MRYSLEQIQGRLASSQATTLDTEVPLIRWMLGPCKVAIVLPWSSVAAVAGTNPIRWELERMMKMSRLDRWAFQHIFLPKDRPGDWISYLEKGVDCIWALGQEALNAVVSPHQTPIMSVFGSLLVLRITFDVGNYVSKTSFWVAPMMFPSVALRDPGLRKMNYRVIEKVVKCQKPT